MADQTTLIGTTGADLRPLGVRGEPLHGTAAQLRRVVRRRLGDATADLLADPQPHEDGSTIDWYAGWTGDVQSLADLEPGRRAQVLDQVDRGLAEIDRLGETLAAAGGVDDATLVGRSLRLAARRPGDAFVFLVGDKPVVTCWGYEKEAAGLLPPTPPPHFPELAQPPRPHQPVLAPDQTPLPPAFVAPAVIAAARPSVPWLRVLAIALPLLALLLGGAWFLRGQIPADPALSLATREGPDALPPGPAKPNPLPVLKTSLSGEQAREKALRLELSAIEEELKKRVAACKPLEPPKPPPQAALAPPPPPPPPPAARPITPPPLRDPQQSYPSDNRLRLPSGPTNNFTFLQGCWRTDPFYHERVQSQPGVSTYCFGSNGGGQLEWRRGRTACRTRAQANYSGSALLLRDSDTNCNDGSQWYSDQLVCRPGADNVAFCSGESRGTFGRATWTVNLHKLN
jgi:hypothetical protein